MPEIVAHAPSWTMFLLPLTQAQTRTSQLAKTLAVLRQRSTLTPSPSFPPQINGGRREEKGHQMGHGKTNSCQHETPEVSRGTSGLAGPTISKYIKLNDTSIK